MSLDLYVAERSMEGRLEERRSRAESRYEARQMRSQSQPSFGLGRRLACELGYRLVAMGAWLERYGYPLEGELSRSN
jgi:hypothetical protein